MVQGWWSGILNGASLVDQRILLGAFASEKEVLLLLNAPFNLHLLHLLLNLNLAVIKLNLHFVKVKKLLTALLTDLYTALYTVFFILLHRSDSLCFVPEKSDLKRTLQEERDHNQNSCRHFASEAVLRLAGGCLGTQVCSLFSCSVRLL